jgi:histidinol phosphatase-like enzyme
LNGESPPLAPGLFELHAPADDVEDRKPRAELFEELGEKYMRVRWAWCVVWAARGQISAAANR